MQEGSQLSYVLAEINDRLRRSSHSVAWYRSRHFLWQMSSVTLSGVVTILAGLKLEVWGRADLILVISAISTVVAAWGAFFAPKDLWHLNSETFGKVRTLQAKIEFNQRDPEFAQRENVFAQEAFAEYQAIVEEHNQRWLQTRQKSS